MDYRVTTLERAFQLAGSGRFSQVEDIIEALSGEGYSVSQIYGPVLKRQLRGLIAAARQQPPTEPAAAPIIFDQKARVRREVRRFRPPRSQ
jgi:hypothetical protein